MEPVPSTVENNDEPFEPCPTPLSWQDVVREFVEQSDQWTTTVDGVSVSGRSIGDGPPLYFVNGLTGDMNLLSLTVWLVKEEYKCVLFDWPDNFKPASADALTDLLIGIADHHGDEKFSIFSTGAGCVPTFAVMQQRSARVHKAILQGGFAKCELSFVERAAVSVGSVFPGLIGALPGVTRILQQNHRPWFPPFDTSRWSFAEQNLGCTPVSRLARIASVLKTFDFTDKLSDLTTPTLLVRCEGDSPIQVTAQDKLEASIPGVSVEWLHTCGRLPFLTHPHRLKRILLDFLSDHPSA